MGDLGDPTRTTPPIASGASSARFTSPAFSARSAASGSFANACLRVCATPEAIRHPCPTFRPVAPEETAEVQSLVLQQGVELPPRPRKSPAPAHARPPRARHPPVQSQDRRAVRKRRPILPSWRRCAADSRRKSAQAGAPPRLLLHAQERDRCHECPGMHRAKVSGI